MHDCALHSRPTGCLCQGRSTVQLVPESQGYTRLARGSHEEPEGAAAVVPSCLRRMQPSAGGLQERTKPPWLLWFPAQGHKPKGNVPKLPPVMSGGILAWKESKLPLLWGAGCSRDVAGGGLGPLSLTMSRLAVLGDSLVALAPSWGISACPFPAAVGSSCSLLPAPAWGTAACHSLGRRAAVTEQGGPGHLLLASRLSFCVQPAPGPALTVKRRDWP